MTRPTKRQIETWHAFIYERLPEAEAMRRLRIKHKATFHWLMNTVTKHVLRKHPRIV